MVLVVDIELNLINNEIGLYIIRRTKIYTSFSNAKYDLYNI